ncbi:amidohydrolase [Microbacterium amylolyticum]|uniref:Amidohydrolase YtcJ n=1 Tax=Microbacterium amylolyticum TaxID=936337 RepID=A0ABS4ZFD5_9MICO|nr:amidohydrolase family protein [Microbacterium amylolyticum]MBP2435713.1 putative amidohydrolase YtcJ [Microbacterium amylolyticum]
MDIRDGVDVITNVRVAGEGRELLVHPDALADGVFDVWIADGCIADIAPAGNIRHRGRVLDGEGNWLIPGLWDHHVHFLQWSLASTRPSVEHARSALEAAAFAATIAPQPDGRRILSRWRDALWDTTATRAVLDAATGEVPTYLLSLDVHGVWMNSAAFRREGITPDAGGVLRETAAFALIDHLDDVEPLTADAAHSRAAARAAARGVVGIWDLEFGENHVPWRRRAAAGWDGLRVFSNVYPEHLDTAIAQGLRTGDPLEGNSFVRMGMQKVFGDGSLGTRTAATSGEYSGHPRHHGALNTAPDQMTDAVVRAAVHGIETTIHAIGDRANTAAIDAFARAGVPGRIEHAQLVHATDIPRFARLGIEASVQPQHLVDDRDLTDAFWSQQPAMPYPFVTMRDAGVSLLFGSDAPVSVLDPWAQIAAAVYRTDDHRPAWQPEQAIDARTALAASTLGGSGDPQRIEPGTVADLAIVAADPLTSDRERLRAMPVAATMIAGCLTHTG